MPRRQGIKHRNHGQEKHQRKQALVQLRKDRREQAWRKQRLEEQAQHEDSAIQPPNNPILAAGHLTPEQAQEFMYAPLTSNDPARMMPVLQDLYRIMNHDGQLPLRDSLLTHRIIPIISSLAHMSPDSEIQAAALRCLVNYALGDDPHIQDLCSLSDSDFVAFIDMAQSQTLDARFRKHIFFLFLNIAHQGDQYQRFLEAFNLIPITVSILVGLRPEEQTLVPILLDFLDQMRKVDIHWEPVLAQAIPIFSQILGGMYPPKYHTISSMSRFLRSTWPDQAQAQTYANFWLETGFLEAMHRLLQQGLTDPDQHAWLAEAIQMMGLIWGAPDEIVQMVIRKLPQVLDMHLRAIEHADADTRQEALFNLSNIAVTTDAETLAALTNPALTREVIQIIRDDLNRVRKEALHFLSSLSQQIIHHSEELAKAFACNPDIYVAVAGVLSNLDTDVLVSVLEGLDALLSYGDLSGQVTNPVTHMMGQCGLDESIAELMAHDSSEIYLRTESILMTYFDADDYDIPDQWDGGFEF